MALLDERGEIGELGLGLGLDLLLLDPLKEILTLFYIILSIVLLLVQSLLVLDAVVLLQFLLSLFR